MSLLRWPEVAPRLAAGAVAVLPIGSAAKEHGRHLPMDTDFRQAEALGSALAAERNCLVWPALGYGFYPAFTRYPGSTSINAETFSRTVADLVADLERAGAKRTLVINTGISTIPPIEQVIGDHKQRLVTHVYRSPEYLSVNQQVCDQPRGGHADEAETSVMLHLFPNQVQLELARPWTSPRKPGPFVPNDPQHPGYSPDGVYGDPTLATAEKGKRLFKAMVQDLTAAYDELSRR